MKRVHRVIKRGYLYYWLTSVVVSLCCLVTVGYHLTVNNMISNDQIVGLILNLQYCLIDKAISIGTVCSPHRIPEIQIPIDSSTNYSLPASRGFLPRVL